MKDLIIRAIETTIKRYPAVLPHLTKDVFEVLGLKTYDYMLANISRMVSNVYTGNMGGEFVDIMGALIRGQMRDAYRTAYADAGFADALPDWLQSDLEIMQTEQASFDFIYQYYKDIIDARVDGTPLQPLLDRVPLWANRYNEAVSRANMTIQAKLGGRLVWRLGETEEHCTTCAALNGIVAFASEWELSGVKPQNAPNPHLECQGWRCDCSLEPTDKRRSPNAWDRIMGVEAKHYGPGNHPGTGTPQDVHGGDGGVSQNPTGESNMDDKIKEWKKRNLLIAKDAPHTPVPSNLQKHIDDSYALGKVARAQGITSGQEAVRYDEFYSAMSGYDTAEFVSFEAGMRGNEKPYWVDGWRYGKVPQSGHSMNFAESRPESGVSAMALSNGVMTNDVGFEMFGGGTRDIYYVSGFLNTNTTGSDGEPLLLWAKETGKRK